MQRAGWTVLLTVLCALHKEAMDARSAGDSLQQRAVWAGCGAARVRHHTRSAVPQRELVLPEVATMLLLRRSPCLWGSGRVEQP